MKFLPIPENTKQQFTTVENHSGSAILFFKSKKLKWAQSNRQRRYIIYHILQYLPHAILTPLYEAAFNYKL